MISALGLTGPIGAGKGTVARILEKQGFEKIVLSDFVRFEIRARGQTITRESLQEVSNELRKKFGADVLGKKAILKIFESSRESFIIDGIRNSAELKILRKLPNFHLIAVTAAPEVRFRRILKRRGPKFKSFGEFLNFDQRETSGAGGLGQEVGKVIRGAEISIENNGTETEFRREVKKVLSKLKKL